MSRKFRRTNSWQMCLLILTLVGLTYSSFGDVLCIGEDGHIEIESTCQPCCGEPNDFCSTLESDAKHNHHDECDNCSDLSLDGQFWQRKQADSFLDNIKFTSFPSVNFDYISHKTDLKNSLSIARHSCPGRIQIAASISATVIIC